MRVHPNFSSEMAVEFWSVTQIMFGWPRSPRSFTTNLGDTAGEMVEVPYR